MLALGTVWTYFDSLHGSRRLDGEGMAWWQWLGGTRHFGGGVAVQRCPHTSGSGVGRSLDVAAGGGQLGR